MPRTLWLMSVALVACESSREAADGFLGGDFQVTISNATDMCEDAGLESIFLPTGNATDFESSMELPGVIDLPWTHTVDFVDPFGEMQVTFEEGQSGEDWMQALEGAPPPAVEIDPTNAPDCFVNGVVDMYMQVIDSNALSGTAILHLESFDEVSCPPQTDDTCEVKLDLRWQRL